MKKKKRKKKADHNFRCKQSNEKKTQLDTKAHQGFQQGFERMQGFFKNENQMKKCSLQAIGRTHGRIYAKLDTTLTLFDLYSRLRFITCK